MKTMVRLTVFFFLFCGQAHAESNPYMPVSNNSGSTNPASVFDAITEQQRQQVIQNFSNNSPGTDSVYAAPTVTDTPLLAGNDNYQELRSQESDINASIVTEKTDRARDIQALKDAVDGQLRDMQRKIDAQQVEIDDLRYKNRFQQ